MPNCEKIIKLSAHWKHIVLHELHPDALHVRENVKLEMNLGSAQSRMIVNSIVQHTKRDRKLHRVQLWRVTVYY